MSSFFFKMAADSTKRLIAIPGITYQAISFDDHVPDQFLL